MEPSINVADELRLHFQHDIMSHLHPTLAPLSVTRPTREDSSPPNRDTQDSVKHFESFTGSPSGIRRFQRKMRDVDTFVVWYLSEGPEPLSHFEPSIAANPGDLFIHRRGDKEEQIWVVGESGTWSEIVIGGKHPLLSEYRLHLLANGDPGWVTKKTATTYRGRQKRQANAVSHISSRIILSLSLTVRH